jgi:hypothetical protein
MKSGAQPPRGGVNEIGINFKKGKHVYKAWKKEQKIKLTYL